ncbi:Topoisomerase 1-associated factor 1 [Elasticomyces elasticus]|nr:Topoisomerase 1-associated factor 1 [Elasticomyces elasticus]KAK4966947.1 Topoisomerase 1-associated factor 1 [Elasticomyces elasticus]
MEVWEKSETIDPEVKAYVFSLVSAVGGSSSYDDTYQVGDDAYAALQDILRWLRLYDEKLNRYDVKACLASANLVQNDLLEILALWPEEAQSSPLKAKLALACLQLLVPLTWPAELEDDKTTVNHHRHLPHLQLAQVSYKRAVLHYEHAQILRTAVRIGLPSMVQPRRERSKRDEGIIKLVLYLFRNISLITQPQLLPSQGDENEISRSSTISAFATQDVFTLLLTIGSGAGDEFQDQDTILLEILFHLLKGVDANKLFMEEKHMHSEETNELQSLMRREKAMHKGYNRHAPSRHNRFGSMLWVQRADAKLSTVSGQTSIVDGDATLLQMDQHKRWDKPKFRGKQTSTPAEQADFGEKIELDERARKHLRTFVEDFLDSSFNPLFSSLRKAIEREAERVGESHKRQYFYLIHWFLRAENARHAHRSTTNDTPQENTFAYVAAVLDQETFVLLNRHMQRSFDEKSWIDLQATLLAFTQILATVKLMAESKDEDDQEIAENIQNRIFYEEATHDRIVQILRGYTNQGFAYLDAVTECVHDFVRMLEGYSKVNADLHVRSKRRARRKKAANGGGGEGPPEDEAEEEREMFQVVSERKFDFARFSAKFLSQACVDTFLALLHFHADLTGEQLKRCHRYLYRLAFKHELAILLFRVDILLLLHRLIKGPGGLSPEAEEFKEWEQLVQQVFRRCVKWIEKPSGEGTARKEMSVVEMLFSKVPNTVYYLQNGYERVVEKRAPRAPAELDFKKEVESQMKVPVVVSLLLEQGKGDVLGWLKKEVERAVEERKAWEDEREARGEVGSVAPSIYLSPDTDERKLQLFRDKHLRLLLTTIGMERLGLAEDVDASWIIPSEISSEQLKEALEAIKQTEHDPPAFEDGKTAADMLRNKSAARRTEANTYNSADEDGAGSGSDGELEFPRNLPQSRVEGAEERPTKRRRLTKRNHVELTDAKADERAAERRRKEKERNSRIKSKLYVSALDDESDAEADAEFFSLEEERRKKTAGEIGKALMKQREGGDSWKVKKGKKKGGKKRKVDVEGGEEEDEVLRSSSPVRKRAAVFEEGSDVSDVEMAESDEERPLEERPEDTPLTSPMQDDGLPLTEVSVNIQRSPDAIAKGAMASDDDEDDVPVRKATARRSVRAGLIIDSDSE